MVRCAEEEDDACVSDWSCDFCLESADACAFRVADGRPECVARRGRDDDDAAVYVQATDAKFCK